MIEAAFTVLREMVLRSEDGDAPRRLARLGAAHRTLSDPERRAAHDLLRGVTLQPIDEGILDELLTLAVANTAPEEVMPAVVGPPGWTLPRREAFVAFHRARAGGLEGPEREAGFAVVAEGRAIGVARLAETGEGGSGRFEVGIWIGRSARGRGIGTAALTALARQAASLGAREVIALTTTDNGAALSALRRAGATISTEDPAGRIRADLPTRAN